MLAETDILPGTRKTAKRRTNIDISIDLGCFCPSGTFDFCHKTYNYTYTQKEISFYRGYTGHEHLLGMGYFISLDPNEIKPPLEIINMNGRIYDPILGQFMQPDNYIQTPEDFIGYDRYAYCRNNPFKYTDPSGEFFLGTVVTCVMDFVRTVFEGGLDLSDSKIMKKAWKKFDPSAKGSRTNNAWKIDIGSFVTDPNQDFWGRAKQLISRWTWELPQTVLGKVISHVRNYSGNVDRVDYLGGATFVTSENNSNYDGYSLGNYIQIRIPYEISGDFKNAVTSDALFMHEYGHTYDSQKIWGPLYLIAVGVPSLWSAMNAEQVEDEPPGVTDHRFRPYEMRANRYAADYFRKYYGVDWSYFETYHPRTLRKKP